MKDTNIPVVYNMSSTHGFPILQEKDLPDYACLCFTDNWVKCDDDKMSNVTSEDILKLSGGGKCLSGGGERTIVSK